MGATRILEKVPSEQVKRIFETHTCTFNPHALFRLSEGQRNVFKEDEIARVLKQQKPLLAAGRKTGFIPPFTAAIKVTCESYLMRKITRLK